MVNKEFFAALADLEREKGISQEMFIEALQNALVSAYKKQYADKASVVDIKMNPEKNTIKFFTVKTIVDEVTDVDKEISLEDALTLKKGAKVGEVIADEFIPKDFGRIAAQTAKQVILQKLHETERDNTLNEFADKENELLTGIVRKVDAKNVCIELGKGQIEGIMLPQDQVPGEKYIVNDRIKVYVKRVKNDGKNAQVLVSRSASGLVKRLFENEVPEIKQGIVTIKSISREAGQRTKIAIYSEDENVDAVGACVGPKGMRVNAIVEELNGEKMDIIPWSENPLEFIAKSLSPAKVISVTELDGDKQAIAVVPDDKLSLAIGRNGQNVRLAARLTGWKIDVKSESVAQTMDLFNVAQADEMEDTSENFEDETLEDTSDDSEEVVENQQQDSANVQNVSDNNEETENK